MRPNQDMNVDAFEDSAVRSSNTAKRVALGAAALAGGAVIGGGAVYAATSQEDPAEESLTIEDVKETADVAGEAPEQVEQVTITQTVEQAPEPEPEPEPEVNWDETTNIYVNGELAASIEEGTFEGHDFMLADTDGDGNAEFIAIDADDSGNYSSDEIVFFDDSDNVMMGHETAHTTDQQIITPEPEPDPLWGGTNTVAAQDGTIYNDFAADKAGEEYDGDFAENNPDYNNDANTDDYMTNSESYLAENDDYDTDNMGGEDCLA